MTQPTDPPWLAAHKAAQAAAAAQAAPPPVEPAKAPQDPAKGLRDPGGRWLPGVAPNPNGRPPGTPDKRYALRQRLNGAAEAITEVVIDAALKGSLDACQMVLSRAVAPLRPHGRHVEFKFDLSASLTEQAQSVVNACAEGHLTVEETQMLVQALANAAGLKSIDHMEDRLRALEGRAERSARTFGAGMVIGTVDEKGNLQ